jgi:hypothetical protein
MESSFDVSWIEESERMCSIETNLLREKLSSIPMMFIYINQHFVIDSVEREILLLPEFSGSIDISLSHIIPKEKLIKLVKSKQKKTSSSKYILKETLLYHIPLEPEQISSFIVSQEKETSPFLRIFPIIEDIILPPSLFIFHSVNGLYFFYYEVLENIVSKKSLPIKSILKSESSSHVNMIMTKKVKINIPNEINRKRFTRKNTILL